MAPHRIGIIGFGKIAQDQHLPAIRANPDFELLAVSSQRGLSPEDAKYTFTDYREMLKLPDLDAVAICTPPQVRHDIAKQALLAGKSALLEKPPAATLSELEDLKGIAGKANKTLFTAWHAQHNAGVTAAAKALAGQSIKRLRITWKEDVRHWHPGQEWIWQAGGFGVFDPGINALSILSRIAPDPIFVRQATLEFPSNRDAPIAAALTFSSSRADADLQAVFDWRETGTQIWDIEIETVAGTRLLLTKGGSCLEIDGKVVLDEASAEYEGVYRQFDALLSKGQSEVDDIPFRLVADAFMIGRRLSVDPFTDATPPKAG
ncbi:Gfo/Idh/MocA family protein [Microvirga antarctica]|uniref:Gfo/Idh/MocA family protein n=1 Tax=Microvirga antarctica TaxID=2819233 RepID=UPI001B304159|nr:Gfo/Idh/MocA family oxidoreductase [Microvirga antarctica]